MKALIWRVNNTDDIHARRTISNGKEPFLDIPILPAAGIKPTSLRILNKRIFRNDQFSFCQQEFKDDALGRSLADNQGRLVIYCLTIREPYP